MFKPTLSLLSKALRLPLTSKRANKDFYKGTRTGNIMQRKRIALADRKGRQLYDSLGREASWNLMGHRIDEARVNSFVVPPGLAETELRPYVFIGKVSESGVPRPAGGYPGGHKMAKSSRPGAAGGGKALDGNYYEELSDTIWQRRETRNEAESDLKLARAARDAGKGSA